MQSIWDYYYNEALDKAKSNDISGALTNLIQIPVDYIHINEVKRLLALSYIQLGYYIKAGEYTEDFPDLNEQVKTKISHYEKFYSDFNELLSSHNYKKALKLAVKYHPKSVTEHNMLGMLYTKCGDKENAQKCFLKALEIDRHNKISMDLLINSGNEQGLKSAVGFFKRILGLS